MDVDMERPGRLGQWCAESSSCWLLRPDCAHLQPHVQWHDLQNLKLGIVWCLHHGNWKTVTNQGFCFFTVNMPAHHLFLAQFRTILKPLTGQSVSEVFMGVARLLLGLTTLPFPLPSLALTPPIYTCWSHGHSLHAELSLSLIPGNSTCNSFFFFFGELSFIWGKMRTIAREKTSQIAFRSGVEGQQLLQLLLLLKFT